MSDYTDSRLTEIKKLRKRVAEQLRTIPTVKPDNLIAQGHAGNAIEAAIYKIGRDVTGDYQGIGVVMAEQFRAEILAWVKGQIWPIGERVTHTLYIGAKRRLVVSIPDEHVPALWAVGQRLEGDAWVNVRLAHNGVICPTDGELVCALTPKSKLIGRPRLA